MHTKTQSRVGLFGVLLVLAMTVVLTRPAAADDNLVTGSRHGRLISLAIGLDSPGSASATNDAQSFAHAIQGAAGLDLYSAGTGYCVAGANATRSAVLDKLDQITADARKNDTIVLLLTGTAFEAGSTKSLYFDSIGADSKDLGNADDTVIQQNALSWDSVSSRLLTMSGKVRRVVVFIDTSYGGQTVTSSLSEAILKRGAHITVFASSKGNQQAMEDDFDGVRHGVFTHYLLDAMSGKLNGPGGSSLLTLPAIATYVQLKVDDYSDQTQTPILPFVFQNDYNSPLLSVGTVGEAGRMTPPLCRIVSAKVSPSASGFLHVVVQGSDDDDVTRFELYVNGVPVPQAKAKAIIMGDKAPEKSLPVGDFGGRKYSRSYAADIPIPRGVPSVNLRAVAYAPDGLGGEDLLSIPLSALTGVHGDLYVLTVGVRAYANADYDLDYADRDAGDLSAFLAGQQGRLYRHVYSTCLENEHATPSAIRAALSGFENAGTDDTVMVLLSGHGVQKAGKFYFATYNVDVSNIEGTCIAGAEIVQDLRKVLARKLLFIDACRSGSKLGAQEASASTVADSTNRDAGILVVASCMGSEFSYEDRATKHGVFTEALLETLAGQSGLSADGTVPVNEIMWALPDRMAKIGAYPQTPYLMLLDGFNLLTPIVKP